MCISVNAVVVVVVITIVITTVITTVIAVVGNDLSISRPVLHRESHQIVTRSGGEEPPQLLMLQLLDYI